MSYLHCSPGIRHQLFMALVCTAPLFVCACDIISPGRSTRAIRVDSVTVLASDASPTVVPVRFWGWVGSDGCSSLKSVERTAWPDSMLLRFVAEQKGGNCTTMPVPLEHVEAITPAVSAVFTVIVRQPDNSLLRERVTVR